jgi:hypothetical protein
VTRGQGAWLIATRGQAGTVTWGHEELNKPFIKSPCHLAHSGAFPKKKNPR